ncbi:hypothetical protein IV03_08105 [Pseudomonas congelans]|nr:hypothetical protein IV03_08105 [Pseudomonas congelans]
MVAVAVIIFALALALELNAINLDTAVQNGDLDFSAADTEISDGEEVVNGQHVAWYDLHIALRA